MIREATERDKQVFNKLARHPLQSWEWGNFRKITGVEVTRFIETKAKKDVASYQITWHAIPKTGKWIGYVPKSEFPSEEMIEKIKSEAKKRSAIFVKFEPNERVDKKLDYDVKDFFVAGKPLFTKFTFVLDLKGSEDVLFAGLNQKTRYNVRLATKRGVTIEQDNSESAFEDYWRLTEETTKRQGFYAHTKDYHKKMWKEMTASGMGQLFKAVYQGEIVSMWMVFVLNNKLYYPYGASTTKHKEVMANNLLMWEVIRYGKSKNCTEFDMWGSLGNDPDQKDSWYGFHKFKQGYGGELVEFAGTFDLVVDSFSYKVYLIVEKLRWIFLRFVRRLI